jgi:hypothetical protein
MKCIKCNNHHPTYGTRVEKKKLFCDECKDDSMVKIPDYVCDEKECIIYPCFNFKGFTKGLYCKDHQKEGMLDVVNRKCLKCEKIPLFNYEGEINGIYCKEHSFDGMIDVRSKKCENPECNKCPSFGLKDEGRPRFCKKHKNDEMIDMIHKKCQECDERANYNFEGLPRLFCIGHKKEGMKNYNLRWCKKIGCEKTANFNIPGKKSGAFCKKHKNDEMIDVTICLCIFNGCQKERRCNFKGEKKALFCNKHKSKGMIDIFSKDYCIDPKCDPKKASYNFKGEKNPIYCQNHSLIGMIDIKNKLVCEICGKRASFNYKGNKHPIRCKTHKDILMIDVANKKCIKENCQITASYGPLFHTKIHCAKHSSPNEYLHIFPKCEVKGCKTRPYYSDTNYPKRCEDHREETDTNIIEQKCKSCNILNFINVNKGLCNDCYDFFVKRKDKLKEKRIGEILSSNGLEIESNDKIIVDGCSRYRPDYVLDFTYLKIIVEVDEHQHQSYSCECEQTRMIQIYQDFGGIPILFIRYNPDNYIDNKGVKNHILNWEREKIFIQYIKGLKNRIDSQKEWTIPLSVSYLFYNNYNNPQIEEIKF